MGRAFKRANRLLAGVAAITLLLIQTACESPAIQSLEPTSTQENSAKASPTSSVGGQSSNGEDDDPPPTSGQGNTPFIPGTNLLISVVDEQGRAVEEGRIEVSVKYDPEFAYYDGGYAVSLASVLNSDGLLGMYPPPTRFPARIFIQIVTPDGRRSDVLVIKNDEYWSAVEAAELTYVAIHQFDLGNGGMSTDLDYLGE